MDGEPLAESFDLMYAVQHKRPGDHATLQVEREGKKLKVDVTFQAGAGAPHGKR
jgi:S1-C subfamily serine protease